MRVTTLLVPLPVSSFYPIFLDTVDPKHQLFSFLIKSSGHAVTIIIVVCVGFLVFMIVLGVIRIRSAHHRVNDNREEDPEMTWDESSLTITVNPLDVSFICVFNFLYLIHIILTYTLYTPIYTHQQIEQEHEGQPLNEDEDESDSSDDASSYHEDGETSEEEPEPKPKVRSELEWDDTNF